MKATDTITGSTAENPTGMHGSVVLHRTDAGAVAHGCASGDVGSSGDVVATDGRAKDGGQRIILDGIFWRSENVSAQTQDSMQGACSSARARGRPPVCIVGGLGGAHVDVCGMWQGVLRPDLRGCPRTPRWPRSSLLYPFFVLMTA